MSAAPEQGDQLSPVKRALLAVEALQARIDAMKRAATEPIAIVGLGCRFPGGADDPEAFWRLLRDGVDAIGEVPAPRWDGAASNDREPGTSGIMPPGYGGFLEHVDRFDAAFFDISPREAAGMDPQQRLLLEVAWEAIEDAAIPRERLAGSLTGVFVGIDNNEYAWPALADPAGADLYAATGTAHSIVTGRLSYLLDLRGPSMPVDTACSSSLVAVHLACQSLRARESTVALAGGVNLILSPFSNFFTSQVLTLAPDGRCKTFDARADGFVRGEGCGIVVLKRLSDALADGDTIRALIRGSAVNQDGRSISLTAPNGAAQQAVIRAALAQAAMQPSRVGYVEAHGTATALGDLIELEAVGAVLGEGRSPGDRAAISSVKTNIGHLEAAAGIAGLIKVVLSLQHGEIPPHLHFKEPNPFVPWARLPISIPTALTPWPGNGAPRVAGVSAFGFSGTNAHLILEEAPPMQAGEHGRAWHLLPLSARTAGDLERSSKALAAYLQAHKDLNPADVAHTLQAGRTAFAHRQALVCRDLDDAAQSMEMRDCLHAPVADLSNQPLNRSVVMMFPGVEAHYVDMGWGLYQDEPTFRQHVDRCSELLRPHLGLDLRAVLYPGWARAGDADAHSMDPRLRLQQTPDEAPAHLIPPSLATP
ncbi:MAG TPA: type I polyketide synthase, partial [Chloroflexota bacterium]|nr:type I polyketide synthase [Chloroflexota bacterium]